MYVDPITRQTFNYATSIECRNNPQKIIELDPDSDDEDFYVLTPEPLKGKHHKCLNLLKSKPQKFPIP